MMNKYTLNSVLSSYFDKHKYIFNKYLIFNRTLDFLHGSSSLDTSLLREVEFSFNVTNLKNTLISQCQGWQLFDSQFNPFNL